jgi:glycerophosphoryl diester phosphodiesterase
MKPYIFLFLVFIISKVAISQNSGLLALPQIKNKLVVIAHRGDHTTAPENSLMAIQNAIQDGADYVELDIRTTKDGQLVLMHDGTVDRMTNGKGKINELLYDTIRALKLFNKSITNSDTVQIPTFEEALQFCKNKINIYLDFKAANVQQVYNEILKANMHDQMVVYINAPNQYLDWRKQVPTMPLILSLNTKISDSSAMVQYLNKINIDILDGNWNEYTQATVSASTKKGIPVWADMQSSMENEAYWEKGIELGLLGIQTDHPKELVQYLRKLKLHH